MQSDQLLKTYASNYPKSAPDTAQRLVPEQIPGLDLGIHSSIKHIHLYLPKNTLCNPSPIKLHTFSKVPYVDSCKPKSKKYELVIS